MLELVGITAVVVAYFLLLALSLWLHRPKRLPDYARIAELERDLGLADPDPPAWFTLTGEQGPERVGVVDLGERPPSDADLQRLKEYHDWEWKLAIAKNWARTAEYHHEQAQRYARRWSVIEKPLMTGPICRWHRWRTAHVEGIYHYEECQKCGKRRICPRDHPWDKVSYQPKQFRWLGGGEWQVDPPDIFTVFTSNQRASGVVPQPPVPPPPGFWDNKIEGTR